MPVYLSRAGKIAISISLFTILGFILWQPVTPSWLPTQRSVHTTSLSPSSYAEEDLSLGEPVTPLLTQALRDLPATDLTHLDPTLNREVNPRFNLTGQENHPYTNPLPQLDSLLALQKQTLLATGSSFLTPILNFAGQGFTGVNPPDTVGEVGPNYYLQLVNSGGGAIINAYDKMGNHVAGPVDLDSLGAGICSVGLGDGIVLYDELANRWLLSEFSDAFIPGGGSGLCVYISTTSDPLGSYYAYTFPTANFPDYPKYGVWHNAYYVSTNESTSTVYALDRERMLAGQTTRPYQRFTAPPLSGFSFQSLTPADVDGNLAPPASSAGIFMRHRDDEAHNAGSNNPSQDFLEIWQLAVDWNTPSNSRFTGPINIPISEIDSGLCGLVSFSCFPQPSGAPTLDPLREVIMWRLQYRRFSTHESLVGNLVTDVDGTNHGGIRWFELRRSGGAWTLYQEGTYAPDAHHRWMGSAAMDGAGNIAVAYSITSNTLFPGIRYAGRLATDPLGTLPQAEGVIKDGTGTQGSNRYGDYSSLNVDPADGCTFWATNMYGRGSSWNTQIATFKFPNTLSVPTLLTPPHASVEVSTLPLLTWSAVPLANQYILELSTNSTFATIAYGVTTSTTNHQVSTVLQSDTTYYWRVTAKHGCGMSAPSAPFSFTTNNLDILLPVLMID